jgi:hypothetical protein
MNVSDLLWRLQSGESTKSIVDDLLIQALREHPEIQAEQREYEAWEEKVINGDPTSDDAPSGVIRA